MYADSIYLVTYFTRKCKMKNWMQSWDGLFLYCCLFVNAKKMNNKFWKKTLWNSSKKKSGRKKCKIFLIKTFVYVEHVMCTHILTQDLVCRQHSDLRLPVSFQSQTRWMAGEWKSWLKFTPSSLPDSVLNPLLPQRRTLSGQLLRILAAPHRCFYSFQSWTLIASHLRFWISVRKYKSRKNISLYTKFLFDFFVIQN